MKKVKQYKYGGFKILLGLFCLVFIVLSCDDAIDYQLVRPTPGKQKILIEEVSGVRCPNCPDGTRLLNSIAEEFDSSLIVVTYHAGSFSFPYKESKYDFKTDETVALLNYLGPPDGYPSAVIQRKKADNQSGFQQFSNAWYSAITREIAVQPNLDIRLSVHRSSDQTYLRYQVSAIEDISSALYMHIYVIEDGLIDYQSDARVSGGPVIDYVHNHVLRKIMTPIEGEKLADGMTALEVQSDSILVDWAQLPQIVDPKQVSFVYFITDQEKVLQVEKAKNYP